MYTKNEIDRILERIRLQFNIPTVVHNKYRGLYSFPNVFLVDEIREKESIQTYSNSKSLVITNGKLNKVLLSNIGYVNFTKRETYGLYKILPITYYKEYYETKNVIKVCQSIYNNIREQEMIVVLKNMKIVEAPISTNIDKEYVDFNFYISFLFHYV